MNLTSPRNSGRFAQGIVILILIPFVLWGQISPTTGAVQGKVKDERGNPIAGARVTIRNKATQTNVVVRSDASGDYVSSDPLPPGAYEVRVEARDFSTVDLSADVKAGVTSRADATLSAINPGMAHLESRVPGSEVDLLPINGRNILDLTRLEPGVEIVDGVAIDADKAGFFDLSINDRSGRTTRFALDGIDIDDETVGGTTQNVAAEGVSEIRVTRSLSDISSPLASAGEVKLVSRSGSDSLHGNGFYNFRDQGVGFASFPAGIDTPFQRHQVGGAVGGPIIKDKLFFFVSGEHTKQDGQTPVAFSFPFNRLSSGFEAPFRETLGMGRLDWQIKPGMRGFYRFNYDHNNDVASFANFSPFFSRNNIPSHTVGLDFTTGSYTHSLLFGYSKFVNDLSPVQVPGIFNPAADMNVVVGQLQTGASALGPQQTIQRNLQGRYDGTRPWRKHIFRFGGGVNRIETGGFRASGSLAPTATSSPTLSNIQAILNNPNSPFVPLINGDLAGSADNPLNYPVTGITVYSGRGFTSEQSAFGFPGGGYSDTRIEAFAADTWRVRHNVNVTLGVHYARDTGRTDSDLAPVLCSQINATRFPTPPCTGANFLLDQFGSISGLGNQVRQPNLNIGPQAGVSWDPGSNGRTVVRLGGGLYFQNNLFENVFPDRGSRVAQGQFSGSTSFCPNGAALFPDGSVVNSIDGLNIGTQICGQPIGSVAAAVTDLQLAYQAASRAAGQTNPHFIGNTLMGSGTLAPSYESPRVVQMNFGFQHEIRRNSSLSIDFVRSVGTHFLLGTDTNHVGDASFINTIGALAAINATLGPLTKTGVCSPATGAGSSSLTAVNCYLAHVPNASIVDFARNGLDSGNAFCGGLPCRVLGKSVAAFPGVNSAVGSNLMYFPIGRSRYNGLQMSLKTRADRPARGISRMDLALSYTVSRYKDNVPQGGSAIQDQDLLSPAQDYNLPLRYFGPGSLDRTHRISLSTVLQLPKGLQLSGIMQFASPLPLTLFLPQAGGGGLPGEIFRSDVTGDGTVGDIVPGTTLGTFGRDISTKNLGTHIDSYNNTFANQLTPAGLQLVNSNFFTPTQLAILGAVTPTIQAPPQGNVGLGWLKTMDFKLSRPVHLTEGIILEPSVSAFNLANFANFDAPQLLLSGVLDASPGRSLNNSTSNCGSIPGLCTARTNRIGPGSGVYSLGAPRQLEFQLRLTF